MLKAIAAPLPSNLGESLVGEALTVVFADGDTLRAARDGVTTTLHLVPPFHVSDADAYLVVPDDIGLELIDILRDGDEELLAETVRDSLLVSGWVESAKRGEIALHVEDREPLAAALARRPPYAERVSLAPGRDPVATLNALDVLRCTLGSAFVDEGALERMWRGDHYIGMSWSAPADAPPDAQGEPTYAWTRRLPGGHIGVEFVLFQEYEELVVLLRPLEIVLP